MAEAKMWYLVAYDVREPARWRKVYKLLRGFGTRVQYSIFRVRLSVRQLEKLRWELEKRLAQEDSLLVVGLCAGCVARVRVKNPPPQWEVDESPLRIV